jgi:hypothetical protein
VVVCGGTELGEVAGACANVCAATIIKIAINRIFLFMIACLLND